MPEQPHVIQGSVPLGPPPSNPPPPAPTQAAPTEESPFARQIELPSGGLYYEHGTRVATIRPTTGEEEEAIGATPEASPERVRAIRQVVAACTTLAGLAFSDLLIEDFGAITLHLFALSEGSDEVHLPEMPCPGCNRPITAAPIAVTMLPCTYLRLAGPDTGPVSSPLNDPALAAAAAIEREEASLVDEGPRYVFMRPEDAKEPLKAELPGGTVVTWRLLRIKDLQAAERFAEETGSREMGVGSGLGSYLSARQTVTINGQQVGNVVALQWWKQTPSPILRALRTQMRSRAFGYDLRPELQCGKCRRKLRLKLPNDGSLFRPVNPRA